MQKDGLNLTCTNSTPQAGPSVSPRVQNITTVEKAVQETDLFDRLERILLCVGRCLETQLKNVDKMSDTGHLVPSLRLSDRPFP